MNVYQDVYLLYHGSYANYNSLQVSWQKQSGPVTFLMNYTFGKVLGITDGQTDNGAGNGSVVDPFSIRNNYGPLAYDHTHILNASYVWNMPKFVHGNAILGGAVNGWQLSGYTTYQSGATLQPNLGGNLNAAYAGGLTMPTNAMPSLARQLDQTPQWVGSNQCQPANLVWRIARQQRLPAHAYPAVQSRKGAEVRSTLQPLLLRDASLRAAGPLLVALHAWSGVL